MYELTVNMIRAFNVSQEGTVLNTLRKGIVERPYFDRITVYFLNDRNNIEGKAVITIDWNKHSVFLSTGKDTVELDPNRPLIEQVSEAITYIQNHIPIMKRSLGVKKSEVWYHIKNEIQSDQSKYDEARKYCGFPVNKQTPPIWEKKNIRKVNLTFTPYALEEFNVEITHFEH
ncbi:MAG: hypothetical protein GC178_18205 [Flavobacteriales bacterium]|nr:hypothetical protein [Flavobacteriales bacterium]